MCIPVVFLLYFISSAHIFCIHLIKMKMICSTLSLCVNCYLWSKIMLQIGPTFNLSPNIFSFFQFPRLIVSCWIPWDMQLEYYQNDVFVSNSAQVLQGIRTGIFLLRINDAFVSANAKKGQNFKKKLKLFFDTLKDLKILYSQSIFLLEPKILLVKSLFSLLFTVLVGFKRWCIMFRQMSYFS